MTHPQWRNGQPRLVGLTCSLFFLFSLSLFSLFFFFAVVTVATDGSIGRCHGDAPPSPKDDKGDANELGPHYFETTSKLHRFFYRFTSGKKRKQKKSSSHTRNQRPEDFFLGRGGVADPSKSGIPAHFSFFFWRKSASSFICFLLTRSAYLHQHRRFFFGRLVGANHSRNEEKHPNDSFFGIEGNDNESIGFPKYRYLQW